MSGHSYTAFVPIRAGSKGLVDKNIKHFAGIPLYEHAVRQGLRCCGSCVISTDIETVLATPVTDGRCVYRRPVGLASDASSMDDVLKDGIESLSLSGQSIVLLQATSPLRNDTNISEAITLYETGAFDLIMSVTQEDQSILKMGMIEDDRFVPVSEPKYCFSNRQNLPNVYRPTGAIYVFSADWFLANGGLATDHIGSIIMSADESYDIDTADDFTSAEAMYQRLNDTAVT